jgi:hypothetical protein
VHHKGIQIFHWRLFSADLLVQKIHRDRDCDDRLSTTFHWLKTQKLIFINLNLRKRCGLIFHKISSATEKESATFASIDLAATDCQLAACADGTYKQAAGDANFINSDRRHQLVIDGDAGDAVSSSGWGTSVGTVTNAGVTYNVYNQGLYAQLLIDTAVTQIVL